MSVIDRVRAMTAEHLCIDPERVVPGARFIDDLGADSLDKLEIGLQCEDAFSLHIDDDEIDAISTVADLVALVERKATEKGAAQ